MAFLSNQAATKQKEKKVKKVPKIAKLNRTNSITSETNELPPPEVTTPVTDMPSISANEPEDMEVTNINKKKKKVTWASDDNLTTMHFFELDESERGKF